MIRRWILALTTGLWLAALSSLLPATAQDLPPTLAIAGSAGQAAPLIRLTEGLAESLRKAAEGLRREGGRMEGTTALDDARRAARVLRHAAPGEAILLGHGALAIVEAARKDLQNGAPERAARILEHGSASLARVAAAGSLPSISEPADKAVGMDLINAYGARLGEVERMDGDRAIISTGGIIGALGFLDWGTVEVAVPAADLVPGEDTAAYPTIETRDQFSRRGG